MRIIAIIFPFCFLIGFQPQIHPQTQQASGASPGVTDTLVKDTVIRIDAKPASGFNFPYYIFIPRGTVKSKQFLLVETNNTGGNDTLAFHDAGARKQVSGQSSGWGLSRRLRVPFLMPAFPRPMTDWKFYTHALDRDAALIKSGDWKRLDLQLIAMINDARKQLPALDITLNEKVLMNGFSASGTFANRFTMIHPEIVAATACGGINAIAMLPVKARKGQALDYPLGLNDFEKVFGRKHNMAAYKKVPQFLYMGEHDDNDAVLFDDGYSLKERQKVFKAIAKKMLPDRWDTCRIVYEQNGVNATFKVYTGIGHGTDGRIHGELVEFFRGAMKGE